MRWPRMQGLLPHRRGSIQIRFKSSSLCMADLPVRNRLSSGTAPCGSVRKDGSKTTTNSVIVFLALMSDGQNVDRCPGVDLEKRDVPSRLEWNDELS